MEPFRDDRDPIAELRSLRPEPSQEFGAELDERVAAGFPRRSSLGRFFADLRMLPPRRLALATGATALAAIVATTAVVAIGEPGTDSASLAQRSPSDRLASPPEVRSAGGGSDGLSAQASKPSGGGGGPGSGRDSTGGQYETAAPSVAAAPGKGMSSSGADGAASTESSPTTTPTTGPFAAKAGHRDVERSAEMVLGADPAEVGGDAAAVFDAVHAADGIVLSSSVSGGAAGDAGARFELLIPAARLSDALAAFSAIDLVVSRHEATDDITAPTVRTGELLRDSRARIDSLLAQLARADTDAERDAAEAELRAERRHNAYLRSQLSTLQRRANFSRVSLRIETGAAATPESGGGWGLDDALGDAGHILAIAAGVTVVGLAIVAPLALVALLAWLANRARLRRARERTLA